MYFFNFEESFFSEVNSCIYFSGFTSFRIEMDVRKVKRSSMSFIHAGIGGMTCDKLCNLTVGQNSWIFY